MAIDGYRRNAAQNPGLVEWRESWLNSPPSIKALIKLAGMIASTVNPTSHLWKEESKPNSVDTSSIPILSFVNVTRYPLPTLNYPKTEIPFLC